MTTPNLWTSLIYQLYLAGVCVFGLVMGVVAAGQLATNGVDLVFPPEHVAEPYLYPRNPEEERAERSPEELAAEQARAEARWLRQTQRDMAHNLIYLLLGVGVFAFHWRLFKARKE